MIENHIPSPIECFRNSPPDGLWKNSRKFYDEAPTVLLADPQPDAK
jgi:hypothetical protein